MYVNHVGSLLPLFFDICSSETSVGFQGLHGVMSQEIELFKNDPQFLQINYLNSLATVSFYFCGLFHHAVRI
jgi:hypothetical protein